MSNLRFKLQRFIFISLLYLDLSLLYCMNVMARVRIEMEHLAGLVLYVRQSPDTDAVKD